MAKVIYIAPPPTHYERESIEAAQIGNLRRDAAEAEPAQATEISEHVAELAIGAAFGDETPEVTGEDGSVLDKD